jgi:hypothetical protein
LAQQLPVRLAHGEIDSIGDTARLRVWSTKARCWRTRPSPCRTTPSR